MSARTTRRENILISRCSCGRELSTVVPMNPSLLPVIQAAHDSAEREHAKVCEGTISRSEEPA